jgi:hypothetical protein
VRGVTEYHPALCVLWPHPGKGHVADLWVLGASLGEREVDRGVLVLSFDPESVEVLEAVSGVTTAKDVH